MTDVIQFFEGPHGMTSRLNWSLRARLAIARDMPPLRLEPFCPRCGLSWPTDADAFKCCEAGERAEP